MVEGKIHDRRERKRAQNDLFSDPSGYTIIFWPFFNLHFIWRLFLQSFILKFYNHFGNFSNELAIGPYIFKEKKGETIENVVIFVRPCSTANRSATFPPNALRFIFLFSSLQVQVVNSVNLSKPIFTTSIFCLFSVHYWVGGGLKGVRFILTPNLGAFIVLIYIYIFFIFF